MKLEEVSKELKYNKFKLDDETLPSAVEMRLQKLIDTIKGSNMNRQKILALMERILNSLGLDKNHLTQYFAQVRKEIT